MKKVLSIILAISIVLSAFGSLTAVSAEQDVIVNEDTEHQKNEQNTDSGDFMLEGVYPNEGEELELSVDAFLSVSETETADEAQRELPVVYDLYDYFSDVNDSYKSNATLTSDSPWSAQIKVDGVWTNPDTLAISDEGKATGYSSTRNWESTPGFGYNINDGQYQAFLYPCNKDGESTSTWKIDAAYTFTAPVSGTYTFGRTANEQKLSDEDCDYFKQINWQDRDLPYGVRIVKYKGATEEVLWPTGSEDYAYQGYARFGHGSFNDPEWGDPNIKIPVLAGIHLDKGEMIRVEARILDGEDLNKATAGAQQAINCSVSMKLTEIDSDQEDGDQGDGENSFDTIIEREGLAYDVLLRSWEDPSDSNGPYVWTAEYIEADMPDGEWNQMNIVCSTEGGVISQRGFSAYSRVGDQPAINFDEENELLILLANQWGSKTWWDKASIAFRASVGGAYSISCPDIIAGSSEAFTQGNEGRIYVTKNNEKIWPTDKDYEVVTANSRPTFEDMQINLAEGDVIRFVGYGAAVGASDMSNGDGNTWTNHIAINPSVCLINEDSTPLGGTTGDCIWIKEGTKLTIRGNGAMGNYDYSSKPPWGSDITEVVVEDGVTSIGEYAFFDCTSLASIKIPETVKSIGIAAFQKCSLLTDIVVDQYNKNYCSVNGVLFSKDKTTVICYPAGKADAYYFVPNGVINIGNLAFSGCKKLTSITLSDSVESIGDSAFSSCEVLTTVTISNSVENIGYAAFYNCNKLSCIFFAGDAPDFQYNVFEWITTTCCYPKNNSTWTEEKRQDYGGDITWISHSGEMPTLITKQLYGTYAMYGATIEFSITTNKNDVFYQWQYMSPDGNWLNSTDNGCTTDTLTVFFKEGMDGYKYRCAVINADGSTIYSNIAELELLEATEIKLGVTCLTEEVWGDFSPHYYFIPDETDIYYLYSSNTDFICCDINNNWVEETVNNGYLLEAGKTYIFSADAGISITGVMTLTKVHNYVCEDESITSCTDGTVANYVCSYCGDSCLEQLHNFVDGICLDCGAEFSVFGICGEELQWTLNKDGVLTITGIGDMTDYSTTIAPWYKYAENITSIVIENGVTSISDYAFSYLNSLKNITIPESVEKIGMGVLAFCTELVNIQVNEDSEYFCTDNNGVLFNNDKTVLIQMPSTFEGEYIIPEGVISIGDFAFCNCFGLTNVVIPSTITSIGDNAFRSSSITKAEIPDSVKEIGIAAFKNCNELSHISLPEGLKVISDEMFCGSSVFFEITIPKNVERIGKKAFYMTQPWPMNMYNCVKVIDDYAFFSLGPISINYYGTEEQFNSISIGEGNFPIADDITFIPLESDTTDFEYTITDGAVTITGYKGAGGDVVIPAIINGCPVISIDYDAFRFCTSITSITLPDSVTSIGNSVFTFCDSLTEIKVDKENPNFCDVDGVLFNKDKTVIIRYPGGKTNTSYAIPDGVTSIGENAFSYCTSVTSVTIPDSVTSIDDYAFWGCHGLTNVTLPDGVTSIGKYAFSYCIKLTSITLPDSVTSIGNAAFEGCNSLTNITIPDSVTSIGNRAFYSCGSLTSITIPDSVTSIDESAFYGCTLLTDVYFNGTEEQWNKIVIGSDNKPLTNANIHFGFIGCDCEFGAWKTRTEPTCENTGVEYRVCAKCGKEETQLIFALGHNYSAVVTAPTCDSDGYTTYTCSRCNDVYKDDTVSALGHSYSATVTPPVCEKQGYTTYVCLRCTDSYTDDYTDPLGHNFGEWLVSLPPSCEGVGTNIRTCSRCEVYETTSVTPLGHNYSATVTPSTCTEQGYTTYTCSRCSHCYKDDYTATIPHTYGEWIVDKNATIYEEGSRHKNCAVCGGEVSETIAKIVIDIETNKNYGLANFTVVNAQTKEPISGANIFISTENDGEKTFATDENGKISILMPVGKQQISAYAVGCITRNLTVNIKAGINEMPLIGLSDKPTYEAELTSKEMTLEEMLEEGIDTNASGNQHVFKHELKLEFEAGVDGYSLIYYMNDNGDILKGDVGSTSGNANSPIWVPIINTGSAHSKGYWRIPDKNGGSDTTVYPISEYFYLIIKGETKWLKEMFDVSMLIINNSETDTLENLDATLELPEGLSLAAMADEQQSLTYHIDKIAEGETDTVHWYVRGDAAGSYGLTARLTGMVMPYEEEIDDLFQSENKLQVWAGDALHLDFEFPNAAYYGEDYPITITLTNVSDIVIYNISHKIKVVQGMEIFYSDGTTKTKIEESGWYSSGVANKFYPGDKIIIETSVNVFFESEIMQRQLEQWIGVIDGIEKLIKAVKAINVAATVTKSVIDCVKTCCESMTEFINTASEEMYSELNLFNTLHSSISDLMLSYSESGNGTFDAVVKLANSGLTTELNVLANNPEEWLLTHSKENITEMIENVNSLYNATTSGNASTRKFDIFDSLRTAVSAIPISYTFKSAILNEDPNNTANIPWSYNVSQAAPQYFGVSNVSKYILSLGMAISGEIYDSAVPFYFHLIPGADDPFNKQDAIKYIQATEDEIAKVKAKDATGKVTFKAWIERNTSQRTYSNEDFLLSCDNQTAVYENGVLTFTGDGMISITPSESTDGTLYVEDSEGNLYTYVIDVVEQHECTMDEREVIVNPTSDNDGFAVRCCETCGEVMDIEILSVSMCEDEHTYGEWATEMQSTCVTGGLKSRSCEVCGKTEYEFLEILPHQISEQWTIDVEPSIDTAGSKSKHCLNCDYIADVTEIPPLGMVYEYTICDEKVTITGHSGHSKQVIIPEEIDGYPVTAIGDNAFFNNSNIESVTIPDSVTSIRNSAFYNCNNIVNVYYRGTESQKATIVIECGNDDLIGATWYYNSCLGRAEHTYDTVFDDKCSQCGASRPSIANGSCGENAKWVVREDGTLLIYGNGATENYKLPTLAPWRDYSDMITVIGVSESITALGNNQFSKFTNLNTVIMDNANCNFGYYVFPNDTSGLIIRGKGGGSVETYAKENGIAFIDPDRLEAPIVLDVTENTVTLQYESGYEYSMDGVTWQKSNIFANVSYDKVLSFYQRKTATETDTATPTSNAVKCIIASKPKVLVGSNSIKVVAKPNYEYCIDDMVWQDSNVFASYIVPNETYTVYQRPKAQAGVAVFYDESGLTVRVNGTDRIESANATHLVWIRTMLLNEYCFDLAADFNDDGDVNIHDLIRLKKILLSN